LGLKSVISTPVLRYLRKKLKKVFDKVGRYVIVGYMATIRISAKCSDMFSAELLQDKGSKEYDGYVPGWFPNPNVEHYGDYVQLHIDVETGQIINWKRPTQAQLDDAFGGHDEES
jgi:hypothetical protein